MIISLNTLTIVSLVLGVTAWVDNAIHVQVQVVKLHLIRVGLGGIHGNVVPIHLLGLQNNRFLRQLLYSVTAIIIMRVQ